jgi:superfamily II DNA or RNA helicase
MRTCIIQVIDEVNVRLVGLDEHTLAKCIDALTFTVPNSHFMEKVRLKRWDGRVSLLKKSGKTFRHLIYKIIDIIIKGGYEIAIDDQRFDHKIVVPEIGDDLFEEYEHKRFKGIMEEHQVEAVNQLTTHVNGIIALATGGGKTIITAALAQLYYQYGKILVVVPRIDLVVETHATITAMGMTDCGMFFDEFKDPKHITVTTWQSLDNYRELFADVIAVIVDEAHGADARVLHSLLVGPGKNVPIRVGMTGTMPEDDLAKYQIQAALGPVIYEKKARALQEAGFLAYCQIFILRYLDKHRKEYLDACEGHDYYIDEIRWQWSHDSRIKHIAEMIREVTKDGTTLVLVRNREYQRRLSELLPEATFLNGDDKGSYRHKIYQETNAKDNAILGCTYGIAAVGVDVPRLKNLVLIEPGKKNIQVVQSIGRGLRKADDKEWVMVYHVGSDGRFSSNHVKEVQRIYKDHEYPYEVIEVDYE